MLGRKESHIKSDKGSHWHRPTEAEAKGGIKYKPAILSAAARQLEWERAICIQTSI